MARFAQALDKVSQLHFFLENMFCSFCYVERKTFKYRNWKGNILQQRKMTKDNCQVDTIQILFLVIEMSICFIFQSFFVLGQSGSLILYAIRCGQWSNTCSIYHRLHPLNFYSIKIGLVAVPLPRFNKQN